MCDLNDSKKQLECVAINQLYETEAFDFKVTWSKSACTVYASCTKYFPYFSNKSSAQGCPVS